MRVSPVGWVSDLMEETLELAFQSALPTHNHPEGIKGAQATAAMIYLARQGHNIETILSTLDEMYLGYEPIDMLGYFDAVCPDTMRLAVHCLKTTDSFETAVFKAVTIPFADADTLGAIVGSIAEALYGIPEELEIRALAMIEQPELREILDTFREKYCRVEKPT
jgi:ADP-ribosylglycohydrolase